MSEEKGYLSEFILRSLRCLGPFVVESLTTYLNQNPSFENNDRLLSIYTTMDDIPNLKEQFNKMKELYDGRLMEEQKFRWNLKEKLVRCILSTESSSSSSSIMDFIRSENTNSSLGS